MPFIMNKYSEICRSCCTVNGKSNNCMTFELNLLSSQVGLLGNRFLLETSGKCYSYYARSKIHLNLVSCWFYLCLILQHASNMFYIYFLPKCKL